MDREDTGKQAVNTSNLQQRLMELVDISGLITNLVLGVREAVVSNLHRDVTR